MRGLCCLALLAGLIGMVTRTIAADDNQMTIKQIMVKAHKPNTSLLATVKKGMRTPNPNWDELQGKTKELVQLAAALAKDSPPKGSKESWEKLTKSYQDNAQALDDAVQKKEPSEVLTAMRKMDASCGSCHKAHKGKS